MEEKPHFFKTRFSVLTRNRAWITWVIFGSSRMHNQQLQSLYKDLKFICCILITIHCLHTTYLDEIEISDKKTKILKFHEFSRKSIERKYSKQYLCWITKSLLTITFGSFFDNTVWWYCWKILSFILLITNESKLYW